jgi:hypothetical protein
MTFGIMIPPSLIFIFDIVVAARCFFDELSCSVAVSHSIQSSLAVVLTTIVQERDSVPPDSPDAIPSYD